MRKPRFAGLSLCAEEDSNLHPVSLDQAFNLVTRVSDPSYASRSSDASADLDGMDAMDDLDVATDVAMGTAVQRLPAAGLRARGVSHPGPDFYPALTMCQIDPNVLSWSPVARVVFLDAKSGVK